MKHSCYTFLFDKAQRRVREKFFSSPMCIFAHALDFYARQLVFSELAGESFVVKAVFNSASSVSANCAARAAAAGVGP